MFERFAVYFAPDPGTLLWQLGCRWHGRDPAAPSAKFAPVAVDRHNEIVHTAAKYGFHATLKAPFRLAPGRTKSELVAELRDYASSLRPFPAPALEVSRIGGFLALTLAGKSVAMATLADDCVRRFDGFRAPLGELELTERRKAPLTVRQDAALLQWGYPYVLEDWLFHMTLTSSLRESELSMVERVLRGTFAPVTAAPLYVDRIALFTQASRDAPFVVEEWLPFGR